MFHVSRAYHWLHTSRVSSSPDLPEDGRALSFTRRQLLAGASAATLALVSSGPAGNLRISASEDQIFVELEQRAWTIDRATFGPAARLRYWVAACLLSSQARNGTSNVDPKIRSASRHSPATRRRAASKSPRRDSPGNGDRSTEANGRRFLRAGRYASNCSAIMTCSSSCKATAIIEQTRTLRLPTKSRPSTTLPSAYESADQAIPATFLSRTARAGCRSSWKGSRSNVA